MAWRASYSSLLEIFPQVDFRIIKGAALDHGADIGSAADFILTEVLGSDDGNSVHEPVRTLTRIPENLSLGLLSRSYNAGEHLLAGSAIVDDSSEELIKDENPDSWTFNTPRSGEAASFLVWPTLQDTSLAGLAAVCVKQADHEILSATATGGAGCNRADLELQPILIHNYKGQQPRGMPETINGSCAEFGKTGSSPNHGEVNEMLSTLEQNLSQELSPVLCDPRDLENEAAMLALSPEVLPEMYSGEGDDLPEGAIGHAEQKGAEEILGGRDQLDVKETTDSIYVGTHSTFLEIVGVEGQKQTDNDESEDERNEHTLLDSIVVPKLKYDNTLEAGVVSILATQRSFVSDDDMDEVCWESVHSSSVHMFCMETLDEVVEQAKSDKETLINSIEELRELRLKTDQVEHAAREAKEEAAKGGLDVMAKVDEMRKLLARAEEANAVHAAEVYGEKAVLTTEARELQSRLLQLKSEKEAALSVLNEIKVSLQRRIENAVQEQAAAEKEKAAKEALAREILGKEELLMSKVARESRELDAEAEKCMKLREFLIEHGSIVDALQGEVAVLCEDAESLKKDLEGMFSSVSGGYVHMFSRPLSDNHNSPGPSRVSKPGDGQCDASEGVIQLNLSPRGDLAAEYLARVPAMQKTASDRRLWTSLPSLIRALSGSQELSSSNHSMNSIAAASNSASSSKSVTKALDDLGEESGFDGRVESLSSKSPSSRNSPSVAEVERKMYEEQMAMFLGENLDLEYAGSRNLDIFRSEKLSEPRGESDIIEDWHLLDVTPGSKKGSSGSSCSSFAGNN